MSVIIHDCFALLNGPGSAWYQAGSLTHLDHAIQCAWIAERDGADTALIVACLLHDIGYLLNRRITGLDEEAHEDHAMLGAAFLRRHMPSQVINPIRLHSIARRYLAAVEDDYLDLCTADARREITEGGGPLSRSQALVFCATPDAEAAVALVRYDDDAQRPIGILPDIEVFRPAIERMTVGIHRDQRVVRV